MIPPDGAVNALGETADEALTACQSRCTNLHLGRCVGVNVLPLTPPPLVIFTEMSGDNGGERGIPYGVGNCNASCFAAEPNPAESMVRFYCSHRRASVIYTNFSFHSRRVTPSFPAQVCYPLKLSGARIVEEDWTLSVNDVHDEIWYSTCYKRELKRVFTGLTTPCMDYVSTDFPDGMCNLDLTPYWRHECVVALLRCLFLFSFALSLCYLTSLLLSQCHVSP